MKIQEKTLKLSELHANKGQLEGLPKNPRLIKDNRFKALKKSIEDSPEFLKLRELIVYPLDKGYIVIAGNQRLAACNELKIEEVPCKILPKSTSLEKLKEYTIKDNVNFGEMDWEVIEQDWNKDEINEWGEDIPDWNTEKTPGDLLKQEGKGRLVNDFIAPPFSVLDTKQGYWSERRKMWNTFNIKSELGRTAEAYATTGFNKDKYGVEPSTGVSIFDPVLCELIYTWFNIDKGLILDPFAGGSVRGIVASVLGFDYYGNDLRREQIEYNFINAKEVLRSENKMPNWTVGDSMDIKDIFKNVKADLLFSCPPYADLEVYSDNEKDISNMDYKSFLSAYNTIIKNSCEMLKDDRFAVFVVSDVRDKKGVYRNFVSHTIQAFEDAGLQLYNEMILVNAVGTLAIRAGRQFKNGRKVGKQHQNLLVFYKGDVKKIKTNYGEVVVKLDQ